MKTYIYILILFFPLSSFSQAVDVSCFGACDGTVQTQPFGGLPPYTFLWSPTGQTTQVATGLCTGIHEVTVWDSTGQLLSVLGYFVAEPPQLIVSTISDTNVFFGDSLPIISPTIVGGIPPYSVSWTPNLINCSLGDCVIADTVPITYVVTVSDSNGCTAVDSFEVVGMLPTGVAVVERQSIKIYPNPVMDKLFIEMDAKAFQTKEIRLIDIVGKRQNVSFDVISPNQLIISTLGLNQGTYFLIINSTAGKRSYKVLKY